MRVNNSNVKSLVDVLHQGNEEQREVVYWGVAYGFVTTCLKGSGLNDGDIKIAIAQVVNQVAELAIIDRVRLEKVINNLYNYFNIFNNRSLKPEIIMNAKTFEEALAINDLIGQATFEIINKNIELFKQAGMKTVAVKEDLINSSRLLSKD